MKTEYPPLYPAGFKDIDISDFEKVFIEPFDEKDRREYLTERFHCLIEKFKEIGLSAELWIDGSFSTEKPEPDDIDMIFFIDNNDLKTLPLDKQGLLMEISSRGVSRTRYNCDVFILPVPNHEMRSYWRGWFGFTREEEPKGIIRLYIG